MISRETILKLLEIESKATPAPWHEVRCEDSSLIMEVTDSTGWRKDYPWACIAELGGYGYAGKNREIIVEARNHLKNLCDSYLQLLDENKDLKARIRQCAGLISAMPRFSDKHPSDVHDWIMGWEISE